MEGGKEGGREGGREGRKEGKSARVGLFENGCKVPVHSLNLMMKMD